MKNDNDRITICRACAAVCGPEGCPEHGFAAGVIENIPRHNALAVMVDCRAYGGDRALSVRAVSHA